MRLAEFIRSHMEPIIGDWETFAASLVPAASHMSPLTLRNHIQQILEFIIADMESAQTKAEQVDKSHGEKPAALYPSAAQEHASLRYDGGFDMDQMVSEYRALRASIVKLWNASKPNVIDKYIEDMTRFDESIDQVLTESIRGLYPKTGTLQKPLPGHPEPRPAQSLGAIVMSSQLTIKSGP
ncbi:MAG: hypothetical protein WDN06_21245 [Asticcacaulis sp.]